MNTRTPDGVPPRARVATALLALGAFALVTSALFLFPFAYSPYAIQNDVYMANLFLAPPIALFGLILLAAGVIGGVRTAHTQGRRWLWWRPLIIAALGAAVVAAVSPLVGGHYESYPPGAVYWPPYLNGWLLIATAVVGVAVTVAGWFWGVGGAGSERPRARHA